MTPKYIIISDSSAVLYYSCEGGVTTTLTRAHTFDDFEAAARQQELAAMNFYEFSTWTVRALRVRPVLPITTYPPRYNRNKDGAS